MTVETIEPLPEINDFDPTPAPPVGEIETSIAGIERDPYERMKEQALTDPLAEAPDTLLPLVEGDVTKVGTVLASFPALNVQNAGGYPADPTLGTSGDRVLVAANNALRLMTSSGGEIVTKRFHEFFPIPNTQLAFDPRILYDRNAADPRFFVVFLSFTKNPRTSKIWLAVSRSNRPNSLDPADWCKYSIDGRRNQGTDQDGYADYPMLGSGADTLVLSNLQLDFIGNSFQFSVVRAFPKLTLIANTNTCPAFTQRVYQPTATAKNQDVYVLQPAAHLTNPTSFSSARNPVYLVSTKAIQTRTYRVWRLSDGFRDTGRLTQVEVSGTHLIGNLPSAQQKLDPGSRSVPLDTRLPHVFQAVGRGDTLWFVHPTLCQIGGGTTEVCVRAVRVGVGQSAQGNYTAAIEQQTVFGGATDGTSYWMPTIAVNSTGQTIIGFLSSSRTTYLSSAWTLKAASATSYRAARVFNPGTCTRVLPEGVFTIRTGDFEGAQTDPLDSTSFWLAGERATTVVGVPNCWWDMRVVRIRP